MTDRNDDQYPQHPPTCPNCSGGDAGQSHSYGWDCDMSSDRDRLEATDPPPVTCIICGKKSRIAGLVGENVCSAVCGWRAEGAAAERARIEPELFRLRQERDDALNDAKSYRAIAAYDEGEADGRADERARWRSVLQPYVLRCVRQHGSDELVERLERALGIREAQGGDDAPPP
jgi:hypothetical protein